MGREMAVSNDDGGTVVGGVGSFPLQCLEEPESIRGRSGAQLVRRHHRLPVPYSSHSDSNQMLHVSVFSPSTNPKPQMCFVSWNL